MINWGSLHLLVNRRSLRAKRSAPGKKQGPARLNSLSVEQDFVVKRFGAKEDSHGGALHIVEYSRDGGETWEISVFSSRDGLEFFLRAHSLGAYITHTGSMGGSSQAMARRSKK